MQIKNNKNNLIVNNYILLVLLIVIVFFNALKTLMELFTYGIFKKEILTLKSNLGFDLKIKIK
tara:strand:- start:6500 stop:6688 length:189 start_codon:yes stop_codon:yes gene_type:complete